MLLGFRMFRLLSNLGIRICFMLRATVQRSSKQAKAGQASYPKTSTRHVVATVDGRSSLSVCVIRCDPAASWQVAFWAMS